MNREGNEPMDSERNEPMSDEMYDDQWTQRLATETETTALPVDSPGERGSWMHPVNTGHLVMGVAFAGILVVWALFITDTVTDGDLRWLTPLPWVLAGAVGLVVATRANLRSRRLRESGR